MIPYEGYTKHLDLIREGVKIGAAKLYYQKSSKTYYLLVSLELDIPDITRDDTKRQFYILLVTLKTYWTKKHGFLVFRGL